MTRVSETELILPALHILAMRGEVTTSELIVQLRDLLKPSGEDLAILANRRDDKFSQKVRNLNSHKTLIKFGVAIEVISAEGQAAFTITDKGMKLYSENRINFRTLSSFSFDKTRAIFRDILSKRNVIILSEDITIFEGETKEIKTQTIRKRSAQLRNAAIESYTRNGRISCLACSFDFMDAYGEIGKNYIEIHHLTPICEYTGGRETSLKDAMQNVIPLCANCHRVVHLHQPILSVDQIKEGMQQAR